MVELNGLPSYQVLDRLTNLVSKEFKKKTHMAKSMDGTRERESESFNLVSLQTVTFSNLKKICKRFCNKMNS